MVISDQEISRCVESLLRHSAPGSVTSVNGVVSHLESKLGLDLSHKTSFIRDQIQLLLLRPPPKDHFALSPTPQLHQCRPSPLVPFTGGFGYLNHELGFRYPASPAQISGGGAVNLQFQQQQQQQQQHQFQAVALPAAVRPVAVPPAKESAPAGVKRRGGPGGLSKVCSVSPELQAIVGEPTMARTEIVKQLWAYIRRNNLQDPNNKRKILCNDELRLVFETDCTDMFKMNKLLTKHIITLEPTRNSGPDSKRLKSTAEPEAVSSTSADVTEYPVFISDALAEFFGTGEREMLESEALRRILEYITANNLEDPENKMSVSCDSKFQQLFGSEKLSALGIPEMLARHLFKQP